MEKQQIVDGILNQVQNRRKHDKGSIGYLIGMLYAGHPSSLYWDSLTRPELLYRFTTLLTVENVDKLNCGSFKHLFTNSVKA